MWKYTGNRSTGNHVWWHATADYGWSLREKKELAAVELQTVSALLFHGPMADGLLIPERWHNVEKYMMHPAWPISETTDLLWAEMQVDVLDWATSFVLTPMEMFNKKMTETT